MTTDVEDSATTELAARARVSGRESQQIFDTTLRTLSEPGTVRTLPTTISDSGIPPALWLPLALATVDSSIHVTAHDPTRARRWAGLVTEATLAPTVEPGRAEFVVAIDEPSADLIGSLSTGTATAPELGARLAVRVERLDEIGPEPDADGGIVLSLTGPGVPGVRQLLVAGIDRAVLELLGRNRGLFPAGIDTWLCTDDGRVTALSRSTTIEIQEQEA